MKRILLLPLLLVPAASWAAEAMIEDITGSAAAKLQPFDAVSAGEVIELGDGRLVLSYLANCRRETISGGKVTVGAAQSALVGGRLVAVEQPPCKAAAPRLLADAREAGAAVKRHAGQAVEAPPVVVVSTQTPAFTWSGGAGALQIWEMAGVEPKLAISERVTASGWRPFAPLRAGVFWLAELDLDTGETRRMGFNVDPGLERGDASVVPLR